MELILHESAHRVGLDLRLHGQCSSRASLNSLCDSPPVLVDGWVAQAESAHESYQVHQQRDEVIRSASLAAMTLLLATQGMNLGSCAMVGFDAPRLGEEFGLADTDQPVMIVTVGYPASGNWPQKPRKPVSTVLDIR